MIWEMYEALGRSPSSFVTTGVVLKELGISRRDQTKASNAGCKCPRKDKYPAAAALPGLPLRRLSRGKQPRPEATGCVSQARRPERAAGETVTAGKGAAFAGTQTAHPLMAFSGLF